MTTNVRKLALSIATLAGAAVGGAAIAGAATSGSTTAARPSGTAPPARPPMNMPAPGSTTHENAEKAVTGDAAAKAQAAAVKAVGSGTAGDVTADYFGKGYEVTVTKSDGSTVEIHLDSSFNVMTPPTGRPGGPGMMPPPSSSGHNN
jgi:hypothetical protein